MTLARARNVVDPYMRAAEFPVVDCFYGDSIWSQGIGPVVISRRLPNGQIAFASFLVDAFCLGVKDVQFDVVGPVVYDDKFLAHFKQIGGIVRISPACARKLVEEAVAYAQSFGILPHSDYQRARTIFGDADASACTEQFTFGKDGKPFFISGPNDSPEKCRRILASLYQPAGLDGADYLLTLKDEDLSEEQREFLASRTTSTAVEKEGILEVTDLARDESVS